LEPLINDLVKLYQGVEIPNPHSFLGKTKINTILGCVVCDIPTTQKVCGFLGTNATKGCSKCLLEFKTYAFGSKPDFLDFLDCSTWELKQLSTHYTKCMETKHALTASSCSEIEKESGARYSELLES